ncbi:MAG: DinB family protein [Flavisolibacter sp.]|nr:DinB family protein [Flavisolibacter sp.]
MINRANLLIPPGMQGYVSRVKETDPIEAISRNTKQFRKLLNDIPKSKASYAYAPGKWTLKEMLQHIIDGERVFAYRALHFARKDTNPLPGFDENQWADNSQANKRKWKELVNEFFILREANEMLFRNLDEQQLHHTGTANNHQASVATLIFVSAGHLDHHMSIIKERYLQPYPAEPSKSSTKSRKKAGKKKAEVQKSAPKKKAAPKGKTQTGNLKKDVGFATPGKSANAKAKTKTKEKGKLKEKRKANAKPAPAKHKQPVTKTAKKKPVKKK